MSHNAEQVPVNSSYSANVPEIDIHKLGDDVCDHLPYNLWD